MLFGHRTRTDASLASKLVTCPIRLNWWLRRTTAFSSVTTAMSAAAGEPSAAGTTEV